MKPLRYAKPTKWIRSSKTGNTYICPIGVPANATEEALSRLCVNESENPQNS